jgi:hypothetical protein
MRWLLAVLLAGVPLLGESLQTSVICTGPSGDICEGVPGVQLFGQAWGTLGGGGAMVDAGVSGPGAPEGWYSIQASLSGDFVLTVTGQSGFGYYQLSMFAGGDNWTGVQYGQASATIGEWMGGVPSTPAGLR